MLRAMFLRTSSSRLLLSLFLLGCSSRGAVGAKCEVTSQCLAGLVCERGSKVCKATDADGNIIDPNPTGPTGLGGALTVAASASNTTVYLGASVRLSATASSPTATLSWSVTKPDTSSEVISSAAITNFAPTFTGTYSATVTASEGGKSVTSTVSFAVKASTVGAWIAFNQQVDGDTYGYYAIKTDGSPLRRMDTPGDQMELGFIPLREGLFAYASLLADLGGHELRIGPQDNSSSSRYGLWPKFTATTCELGTAGTSPVRDVDCFRPLFGLDSDGAGQTLSFLVGRNESGTSYPTGGGDLWVVNPTGIRPTSALVTIATNANPIAEAGLSVDGLKVAVVQNTPDNISSGLGVISNLATPTISTVEMASKISYRRPKLLPDGRVLAVRRLGAAASPPGGESPNLAIIAATPPYDLASQTVVFGLESVTNYREYLRSDSTLTPQDACTAAKAGGALGISMTEVVDYALSPDYAHAVIWQHAQVYSNCADTSTPTGTGRRVVVLDLQTNAVTTLPFDGLGISEVGSAADSRGFTRAHFVGEGQQVVCAFSKYAIGNADLSADLYLANRDGSGLRKLMGSGDSVTAAGGATAAFVTLH